MGKTVNDAPREPHKDKLLQISSQLFYPMGASQIRGWMLPY
ncbi:hypothetical protein AVEN_82588-1, partial [Araneus ventricosus]